MSIKFIDNFDREGPIHGSNGWIATANPADISKHEPGTLKRRLNPYFGSTYPIDPPYVQGPPSSYGSADHQYFTVPTYWGQPLGGGWGYPGGEAPDKFTPYPPQGERYPHPDGTYYYYVVDIGASQKGNIQLDPNLFNGGKLRISLNPGGAYTYPYTTWEINGVTYGHYAALVPYGGYVDMNLADLPPGGAQNPNTRVACWTQDGTLIDYYTFPDQRQYFATAGTFQGIGSAGILRPLAKSPDGWWEAYITVFADGNERDFLGFADGGLILCADNTDPQQATCAVILDWDNSNYAAIIFRDDLGQDVFQGAVNGNAAEPNSLTVSIFDAPAAYPTKHYTYGLRVNADSGVCRFIQNGIDMGGCTIPAAQWARYKANPLAKIGGLELFQHFNGGEYMALVNYESWVTPPSTVAPGPRGGAFVAPPY